MRAGRTAVRGRRRRCRLVAALLDQLDLVAVGVLDEGNDRRAALDRAGFPGDLATAGADPLAAGRDVTLSAAIVASWARYAEGTDEQGNPIKIVDRLSERVQENASGNRTDILSFIRDRGIFGDLVDAEPFTKAYSETLSSLHDRGAEATIDTLLTQVTV